MTHSKSLYDAVSKFTNPASQCGGKRTSIDISLIKQEVNDLNGCTRWVDGRSMLADSLTKEARADLLRHVIRTGQWAILEEGAASQQKLLERNLHFEVHFIIKSDQKKVWSVERLCYHGWSDISSATAVAQRDQPTRHCVEAETGAIGHRVQLPCSRNTNRHIFY